MVMGKLLMEYLQKRHDQKSMGYVNPGPVITISREFGCPEKAVAERLAIRMSKESGTSWKWVNKEILQLSAKDLHLREEAVEQSLEMGSSRSAFTDMISSLSSKYYPVDDKVRRKCTEIIENFAVRGYVIIVGRASEIITKHISRSLHVKLQGPLEWRAMEYANRHGIAFAQAQRIALETDERRRRYRALFSKEKDERCFYDLMINCRSLGVEEITDLILTASVHKNLWKPLFAPARTHRVQPMM